jgi:hypothetical protein
MFRLRYVVAMMTNAVVVGSLIILVLSLGWVGWVPVFGAIALGFVISWPLALIVTRVIKAKDPAWNEEKDRPVATERARRAQQEHERQVESVAEPHHY